MVRSRRFKVLFVCLGNACRSPMAEAIATKLAADVMEASSAGLTPLGHVEPLTIETLARNGYHNPGVESKAIGRGILESVDIIINMSGRPIESAFGDPHNVEDWRVQDPYGSDAQLYQKIFEEIEKRVAELADRIRSGRLASSPVRNTQGKGNYKR